MQGWRNYWSWFLDNVKLPNISHSNRIYPFLNFKYACLELAKADKKLSIFHHFSFSKYCFSVLVNFMTSHCNFTYQHVISINLLDNILLNFKISKLISLEIAILLVDL